MIPSEPEGKHGWPSTTRRLTLYQITLWAIQTGSMKFLAFFLVFDLSLTAPVSPSWFNGHHSYKSHVAYLHRLAADHPSMATVFTAGKSFEQRDILGIHLFGKSGPGSKPAVVFLGTTHAREWITTMVTEYVADRLLGQYGVDTNIKHAMDSFDFYIFPLVNPDGTSLSLPPVQLTAKTVQALCTAKPSIACGARTDRNRTAPHASAAISTVTGTLTGTKTVAPPQRPVIVPTKGLVLSMPPRPGLWRQNYRPSRSGKGSGSSLTGTRSARWSCTVGTSLELARQD